MLYNLYTKEQCLTEYEMVDYLKDKTKPFYVYILVEPETYKPIYVGKGSSNRLFYHWYSNLDNDKNKLKQNKLNKIDKEHGHILYFIHSFFNSEAMAYKQETVIQKSLGLYLEGGLLYNSQIDLNAGGIAKSKKYYIDKCKEVHGDNLSITKVYKPHFGYRNYAVVLCNRCGNTFDKRISHLLDGQGCPKCAYSSLSLSSESVINRFNEKHGDKYDYSKVVYVNSRTEVIITCKKHGDFKLTPYKHLAGCICPTCSPKNRTTEQVISHLKSLMGTNFTFERTVYVKPRDHLIITCKKHGDFKRSYNGIVSGGRTTCPQCVKSNYGN